MKKYIIIILITLIAIQYGAYAQSNKTIISIDNDFYYLAFNSNNRSLSMTVKSTNEVILKGILPQGATQISNKMEIVDPIFGKGNSLIVDSEDSGLISFILYDSMSFS